MKIIFTQILIFACTFGYSQITIDFEEFGLDVNSFLNGSDGAGQFESDGFIFSNNYDVNYDSWSGFSVSTMTDTTTPGFGNQFSSASGNGADASLTYMVASVFGPTQITKTPNQSLTEFKSCMINNSTYARLSMRDGDSFAKMFGGATGDDPDFFELTIRGFVDGTEVADPIVFMLADFPFSDNSQDYIVDEWTEVDLTPLAQAESLIFELNSSDVGQFGMNTPAYFCLDNVQYEYVASIEDDLEIELEVYPNPSSDYVYVENLPASVSAYKLLDLAGRLVQHGVFDRQIGRVDIQDLNTGNYHLVLLDDSGRQYVHQIVR